MLDELAADAPRVLILQDIPTVSDTISLRDRFQALFGRQVRVVMHCDEGTGSLWVVSPPGKTIPSATLTHLTLGTLCLFIASNEERAVGE